MLNFMRCIRSLIFSCAAMLVLCLIVEPALAQDSGSGSGDGSGSGLDIGISLDLFTLLKKNKKVAPKKAPVTKPVGSPAAKANKGTIQAPPTNVPPRGETRFRRRELLFVLRPDAPTDSLADIAQVQHLVFIADADLQLLQRTVHLYGITDGRSVSQVIAALERDRRIEVAQPDYLYQLADNVASASGLQYANAQLNIPEAHKLATGKGVVVALIDSRVDIANPDIGHAVTETYSPAGNTSGEADAHGTAMAGAIIGQGALTGIAPGASLLAVESFVRDETGKMNGTSFNILKGVDWASSRNAMIQNMSFAGPRDPLLSRLMSAAVAKGGVFLAAAGNAGSKSPPQYPAADANVIAITAVDQHDHVFKEANRGQYIALAAPGVDVIVYGPGRTTNLSTGTSVAAAHVTGLVALATERAGHLSLDVLRDLLKSSAHTIAAPSEAVGWGLADALQLIQQADILKKH